MCVFFFFSYIFRDTLSHMIINLWPSLHCFNNFSIPFPAIQDSEKLKYNNFGRYIPLFLQTTVKYIDVDIPIMY